MQETQITLLAKLVRAQNICIWMIMIGLAVMMILTMFVAWLMGWKISRPVMEMTEYTNQMKKAPSLAKKIEIVQEMSKQRLFEEVS